MRAASDRYVPPAEALRELVRLTPACAAIAAEGINDYSWFHKRQTIDSSDADLRDFTAALAVSHRIYEGLRAGRVQARGVFVGDTRIVPIDPADLPLGELHIFDAKLDC